ncbi:hypothetical protein, partial [Ferroplasma sp.]|uniref:hypothetical protein n=1 Tax=Ferroplasma sp. TaxID=2591003 RepID=UPI00307D3985
VDMDVTLLEAISTIMFKDFVYSDLNEVIPHIKRLKPHLNERIMIRAQNKSKELLFHPEYLTDVLKKEIKE